MGQSPDSPPGSVGVVLLAAGYGTRLARGMRATPAFESMAGIPKPLLPVGGRVLLDHWVESLTDSSVGPIVVVTNDAHASLYTEWATRVPSTVNVRVVSDGSTSNDTRLGAVADMQIGLNELSTFASETSLEMAVIIAGDTLLPGVNMTKHMNEFRNSASDIAVFAYTLPDISDCVRRGMLDVSADGTVKQLVEKPAVQDTPSSLATAPVYMLRSTAFRSVTDFLHESTESGLPLDKRDAPGFWLGWAIPRMTCSSIQIESRVDIGGLDHYKQALVDYTRMSPKPRMSSEPAVGRALPRIGFLGNPSDGYGGRCLALGLASEGFAEVIATESDQFSVVPNPAHELPQQFRSIQECAERINQSGIHFGARQLVLAGVSAFFDVYKEKRACEDAPADAIPSRLCERNCKLWYSTNIPVRLGLSGSSAIVLATMRALARFYSTSLAEIDSDMASWPGRVLRAETEKLGIAAGLLDRVAQVYQGCTFTDFMNPAAPRIEILDASKVPELWIAYSSADRVGEHSGAVHGRLRARFNAKDPEVTKCVEKLSEIADRGRACFHDGGDMSMLPALVDENWEARVALIGEKNIAHENVRLVECARRAGMAGKMTGSGGAVLCVPKPLRRLSEPEVETASRVFSDAGLVFRRVVVAEAASWP